jgi:hypothetical protein
MMIADKNAQNPMGRRFIPPADINLEMEATSADAMTLVVPVHITFPEKMLALFGAINLAGFLVGMIYALSTFNLPFILFLAALAYPFCWMFLNQCEKVARIRFSADKAALILCSAVFFHREYKIIRRKRPRFTGRTQSQLAYWRVYQREPYYYLYVKKTGGLLSRRFVLSVNKLQGEWIVKSLNWWAMGARES